MNESAAREVVLVRSVETADAQRVLWTDADRDWASRAALEVAGAGAPAEAFLARRASLALERLATKSAALPRALRAVAWRPWVGQLVVLAAFAIGVGVDRIGPAQRVNVLAFPLLALIAWNLGVYALIAVRGVAGLVSAQARGLGPIARTVARLARGLPRRLAGGGADATQAAALGDFAAAWTRASAPLLAARVAMVLHAAAFALALGAVAGLYLRGLVLEYRAGWESTFLDPGTVRSLLASVLGPASALTGIPVADETRLAAMRIGSGAPGENAGPWIHLYATTVALAILLPRGLLALGTWWSARARARDFRLDLDDPYFRKLTRLVAGGEAAVRVVPYGYHLPPQAALSLAALARRAFGPRADVSIAATVEYGGEDALPPDAAGAPGVALVVALFSLAATPERENHGVFVDRLVAAAQRVPVAVILDESGFRRRFAREPARLEERRGAWRETLAPHGVDPVFVDLDAPDLVAAEAALNAAMEGAARRGLAP
ncbi:MAG: DUF2868 domain-containing protein [Burkholderiales bacterium]|nr:DUF2868 domain-containing protein [Burkholderiales bacterium]